MPRRIFQQAKFNGGMILNADPSDLADGFGVVCLDTMASADSGSITGRYKDTDAPEPQNGYVNVEQYGYITKDGVATKFVHFGADKVYLDGVESTLTDAKCITTHQDYALIGRGSAHPSRYINYDGVNTDNLFACTGITFPVTTVPLDPITFYPNYDDPTYTGPSFNADSNSAGAFADGSIVRYAFSYVFDGFYHSPLSAPLIFHIFPQVQTGVTFNLYYQVKQIALSATIALPTSFSSRITAINIYRSVAAPGLTVDESTEYVNIGTFPAANGTSVRFVDKNDTTGATFEELSGLSETQEFSTLAYTCAYEMNNFLFVGNVGFNGAQVENGGRMLYRSIRGKPAQFRIISEYIVMPFTPVAITSFNKRLIVFGTEALAVVDPEMMTIEEVIRGYGIASPLLLYSAPVGLFFANDTNMFVYDGRQVIPIGDPILRVQDTSLWTVLMEMGAPSYEDVVTSSAGIQRIIYSAKANAILFLWANYFVSGETPITVRAFAFSIDTKTWSVLSFPDATNPKSAFLDLDNRLYMNGVEVMGSSDETVTEWKFLSRRFNFGSASQTKKVYAVHADITSPSEDIAVLVDGTLADPFVPGTRLNALMVKYEPSTMGATLDTLELVYREMVNTK